MRKQKKYQQNVEYSAWHKEKEFQGRNDIIHEGCGQRLWVISRKQNLYVFILSCSSASDFADSRAELAKCCLEALYHDLHTHIYAHKHNFQNSKIFVPCSQDQCIVDGFNRSFLGFSTTAVIISKVSSKLGISSTVIKLPPSLPLLNRRWISTAQSCRGTMHPSQNCLGDCASLQEKAPSAFLGKSMPKVLFCAFPKSHPNLNSSAEKALP